jgi:hypothetical protein
MRLEPQDEYLHPPDAAPNFNESVYVNGFDPRTRVGGWMRIGNRPGEGYAELSVCLYLPDGRVACQFARPPIAGNDALGAGGLSYTVTEPFELVQMDYSGEVMLLADPSVLRDPAAALRAAPRTAAEAHWSMRAVSPVHGGEPTAPEHETLMLYGPEFSRGHFNQHVATRGTIAVGDERFELDGWGWRDHSWGPRYWQVIWAYRLFLANFGADRGLMLLKNMTPNGGSKRLGVLLIDGDYEDVIDLDVVSDWNAAHEPVGARIVARTTRRTAVISARVLTLVPLRNRRSADGVELLSRVAEGFTEYRWDDRIGYGMTEYIERVHDGLPVGYPA